MSSPYRTGDTPGRKARHGSRVERMYMPLEPESQYTFPRPGSPEENPQVPVEPSPMETSGSYRSHPSRGHLRSGSVQAPGHLRTHSAMQYPPVGPSRHTRDQSTASDYFYAAPSPGHMKADSEGDYDNAEFPIARGSAAADIIGHDPSLQGSTLPPARPVTPSPQRKRSRPSSTGHRKTHKSNRSQGSISGSLHRAGATALTEGIPGGQYYQRRHSDVQPFIPPSPVRPKLPPRMQSYYYGSQKPPQLPPPPPHPPHTQPQQSSWQLYPDDASRGPIKAEQAIPNLRSDRLLQPYGLGIGIPVEQGRVAEPGLSSIADPATPPLAPPGWSQPPEGISSQYSHLGGFLAPVNIGGTDVHSAETPVPSTMLQPENQGSTSEYSSTQSPVRQFDSQARRSPHRARHYNVSGAGLPLQIPAPPPNSNVYGPGIWMQPGPGAPPYYGTPQTYEEAGPSMLYGTAPDRLATEADDSLMDIPGSNYDGQVEIQWSKQEEEELLKLLEGAERFKWKYISDNLSRRRQKRIPIKACQNKFQALFGETEAGSRLRSSLFYIAFRSGWDAIKQAHTDLEHGDGSEEEDE